MTRQSDLFYKCRMYGLTYTAGTVSDLPAVMAQIISIGRTVEEPIFRLTDYHLCGKQQRGVADLLGGKATPPEAEEVRSECV